MNKEYKELFEKVTLALLSLPSFINLDRVVYVDDLIREAKKVTEKLFNEGQK